MSQAPDQQSPQFPPGEDEALRTPPASGAVTAPAKPAPAKPKPKHLPPWKVLLHNDDVNTFEHVIATIQMLTTIGQQQAELRATEAHLQGVALLLTTHRERAELYVEQFASRKIIVTIEADK
jgi:ATP-dependent Clp protease adaptor protein ClpS